MDRSLFQRIKKHMSIEHCVVRFLMAWCFISIVQTVYIKGMKLSNITSIQFVGYMNFFANLFSILIVFVMLYVAFELHRRDRAERIVFLILSFTYALLCVFLNQDLYFSIGMCALMTMSVCYCCKNTDLSKYEVNPIFIKTLIVISGAVFVLFTGGCTICKYLSYSSPNYDFGIFSQMFHYMKTTFTMRTTCERDQLLSHMAVHISPIFYLLLPVYAVFSSPITLALLQAVVIALGLIPIYLICKTHKLSGIETFAIAVTYCLYPAMSGGCFYDLHENAFLPPLILLLLYFVEKDSWKGIIISMLLVFAVKEDAPVYVAFIALYMMFGKKMWKKGAAVFISSIIYFIFATSLLSILGDGAMVYRFDNMIYGNGGMLGIIRTVLTNPAYLILQIFSKDKMEFVLQVMLPLLFLPLCTRKWQRFILIGPFIMFNMMSDYTYFHSIFFQYLFGSAALLFYLMILNVTDLSVRTRIRAIVLLPIVSCLLFVSIMWNKTDFVGYYKDPYNQKTYQEFQEALDLIPDQASVTATTFLCPALSKRDILYELYYTDKATEYIALDLRTATTDYNVNTYLNQDQYQVIYYVENKIAVFKNLDYQK